MPVDHTLKPINVAPYGMRDDRPHDENLEEFADNLERNTDRLVILLGAGASIGALGGQPDQTPLPSALSLRDEIWKRFMLPRGVTNFDFTQLGMLSLDQASAFAESKVGREPVTKFIASRFFTEQSLWQHAVLPFLKPRALFTTNYDLLIEQGWNLHKSGSGIRPLVPIFADGQQLVPGNIPLFKPHGSVERALDPIGAGGPVITTVDYFEMLTRKREMLTQWLGTAHGACVLLLGYSMTDMDIGSHLYRLRQTNSSIHWYGVFPRSDSTVRKYWSERLRIRPIDRRFVEFMADLDDLTNFIPPEFPKWKYNNIPGLQAQGVIQ